MNTTSMFCDTHSSPSPTLPPSPASSEDIFPDLSELVLRQIESLKAVVPDVIADKISDDMANKVAEKLEEVKDVVQDKIADKVEEVQEKIAEVTEKVLDAIPDAIEPHIRQMLDVPRSYCCFRKRAIPPIQK